jgi:hypothetical protein
VLRQLHIEAKLQFKNCLKQYVKKTNGFMTIIY